MPGKRWWRRAAAAVKDHCSLCLARTELEVAVIKATSHDASALDYRNAGRVFAWVRTSPETSLPPLLSLLSRRLRRTRNWAVALKGLLLAHGLLLCSPSLRRLPFDLSAFRDPYSPPAFSAFIRAYHAFLARRPPAADRDLDLPRLQDLLDLLMQIRPHADGMSQPLVLEAMDCAVVEIFDIYSAVCNGIAAALVSSSFWKDGGIRVLRRAREQSARLAGYFEVCRSLGVLNAWELPVVDSVAEEDIAELERMMEEPEQEVPAPLEEETAARPEEETAVSGEGTSLTTVVSREWVVFDGDQSGSSRTSRNPFLCGGTPWELHPVYSHHGLCHHHLPPGHSGAGGGWEPWEGRDLLAL